MRTQNEISESGKKVVRTHEAFSGVSSTLSTAQITYHELSDVPVKPLDLIEEIETNLLKLQDLQSRMNFLMREIRYQMKV